MCGIAGVIGNIEETRRIYFLRMMLNKMQHRGPDKYGEAHFENISLGNNRLSIRQLDMPQWPVKSDCGNHVLLYNGEIYNVPQLQRKFNLRNTYNNDASFLLDIIREHGISVLSHINGMFALAFYQKNNNKIFLARDRFGIKPLIYHFDGNNLFFASELKALKQIVPISFLPESLAEYLSSNYVSGNKTIFENIFYIPSGSYIEYNCLGKTIDIIRYHTHNYINQKKLSIRKNVIRDLSTLLKKAVHNQCVSDRPVGIYLSGGLDSSLLAYYASQILPDTNAFCVSFSENSNLNETTFARATAQALKINFHHFDFKPSDFINNFDHFTSLIDGPLADPGLYPLFFLSSKIKETSDVTVLLSGDGGDELFAGYPTLSASYLNHIYKKFPILKTLIKSSRIFLSNKNTNSLQYKYLKLLQSIDLSVFEAHCQWRNVFNENEINLLTKKNQTYPKVMLSDYYDQIFNAPFPIGDWINNLMYGDFNNWLPYNNLLKIDYASMIFSLEARVPFLDNDLVDYMFSLPGKAKYSLFQTKPLMRELLFSECKWLGIHKRPKLSFQPPYSAWFKNDLKAFIQERLLDSSFYMKFNMNIHFINSLIENHCSGKSENSYKLFNLLILSGWASKDINRST